MSSGLNFYQLSSTQTFAVPGQPYFVGTYQSNFAKGSLQPFLSPRSTPGCRYIKGLQHSSLPYIRSRKGSCVHQSQPGSNEKLLAVSQGAVSTTRRILIGFAGLQITTRSGFCSVRAMSWGTVPNSGRQTHYNSNLKVCLLSTVLSTVSIVQHKLGVVSFPAT